MSIRHPIWEIPQSFKLFVFECGDIDNSICCDKKLTQVVHETFKNLIELHACMSGKSLKKRSKYSPNTTKETEDKKFGKETFSDG